MSQIVVCALYKFVALENYRQLRQPLLRIMEEHGVRGTLLLASEGINGTIAGSREGIDKVLAWLRTDPRLANIEYKESHADRPPFNRTKIKLKKEIVTMGVEGIDPRRVVGTYVKPADWNRLISDPEVILIDTRNDYEYRVGTFKNAVNPKTESFREFPQFVKDNLDPARHKKVAMFCTGGIRCEKSTNYLLAEGVAEVFHLQGGILKYLEDVPREDSLWDGACFVFDQRVSLTHGLKPGGHVMCHACRRPLTPADTARPGYEEGVQCHLCADEYSDADRARFRDRQRQVERGELFAG